MSAPFGVPHTRRPGPGQARGRTTRRIVAGLGSAWLLVAAPVAAQSGAPPLSGARVAGEIGAGLLGTPLGFIAGGVTTEWVAEHVGIEDPTASRVALVGAWTGAALATAAGPWVVGVRGRTTGSYAAAVAGSLVGGAASYAVVRLNDRTGDDPRPPCRLRCALAAAAAFALPSIGATVGFNMSRRYDR